MRAALTLIVIAMLLILVSRSESSAAGAVPYTSERPKAVSLEPLRVECQSYPVRSTLASYDLCTVHFYGMTELGNILSFPVQVSAPPELAVKTAIEQLSTRLKRGDEDVSAFFDQLSQELTF